MADNYDTIINDAAAEWNLDPRLLKALILHESGGNPNAVSKAGAQGLGQIMPETQRQLGVTAPFDPVHSIYGAAKYLNEALDKEGTPDKALLYYHGGPGWRQSFGPESRGYVPAVTAQYVKLAPKQDAAARVQVAQATPTVMTDAAPGKPMASDDVLKLLPPAPKAGGAAAPVQAPSGGAGTGQEAAPGGSPLDLLPPAPKPSATATAAAPSAPTSYTDPEGLGRPEINPLDVPASSPAAVSRIGQAVREGWEGGPSFPRVPSSYVTAPIYNPFITTAETVLSGGNALLRGAQQTAVEATPDIHLPSLPPGVTIPLGGGRQLSGELTPGSLGREIAALPEAFPTGGAEMRVPGRPPLPGEPPPTPRFVQEYYGEGTPTNPLAAAPPPERPAFVPPGVNVQARPVVTPPEQPPAFVPPGEVKAGATPAAVTKETPLGATPEGGGPQPVGAQITPIVGESMFSPKEEAAYRATAEGQKLLEPQIRGEVDNNTYIPGVVSNTAEIEQTVEAARDMKQLGIQSPAASQMAQDMQQRNMGLRREYSLNTEKSPTDIHFREQQREADLNQQADQVFAPTNIKGDVAMQPLIDHMRAELAKPRNAENSALQAEFKELEKRLTNKDGTARTMGPEQAWSLRQDIDRMTDKLSTTGDDLQARNRRRVARNIDQVADVLDTEIEKMAPGYNEMKATYRAHSDAIREMQALQGMTQAISTGPNGNLSFAAMQRFMKKVVQMRMTGSQDLNPFKAISEETMQRLWALRDDLRRSAGALELARAAGSDTAANMIDVLKHWGRLGGQGAMHAGASALFGPAGPVAIRMLQEGTAPMRAARAERRAVQEMQTHLNPNIPMRTPPGQENAMAR